MEQIIRNALENMAPETSLPSGTTDAQVDAAITKIMRTTPEIFWFEGVYKYDTDCVRLELSYPFGISERNALRNKINMVLCYYFQPEKLAALSNLEKVTYVYWWLAGRCQYFEFARRPNSIAGVLVDRKARGEGFAKAAQLLLRLLGVRCELVYGRFREEFSYEHLCWNRVYIDGNPFHLDVSCADLTRGCYYHPPEGYRIISRRLWDFFCKSDADIAYNRVVDPDCATCRCRHTLQLRNVSVLPLNNLNPYDPAFIPPASVARVTLDAEIVEVAPDCTTGISEKRPAPAFFIPAWSVKPQRLRRKSKLKVPLRRPLENLPQYHVHEPQAVSLHCRGAPMPPAIDSG